MNPTQDPTPRPTDRAAADPAPSVDNVGGVGGVEDERSREIDLDQVVTLLHAQGIEAEVEQTGGGCATIHAGPARAHPAEPDTVAFAAIAGPGVYGWGQRPSIADLTDFMSLRDPRKWLDNMIEDFRSRRMQRWWSWRNWRTWTGVLAFSNEIPHALTLLRPQSSFIIEKISDLAHQ